MEHGLCENGEQCSLITAACQYNEVPGGAARYPYHAVSPTSLGPLTMSKTYLNPSPLFPSQQYGFSQGVATVGKTTVYLSGQVAWNAAQQITDPADLGTQTRQALENLEIAVRAAGGTRTDIGSLRLYIVGEHI